MFKSIIDEISLDDKKLIEKIHKEINRLKNLKRDYVIGLLEIEHMKMLLNYINYLDKMKVEDFKIENASICMTDEYIKIHFFERINDYMYQLLKKKEFEQEGDWWKIRNTRGGKHNLIVFLKLVERNKNKHTSKGHFGSSYKLWYEL